jgi:hypothetical protein
MKNKITIVRQKNGSLHAKGDHTILDELEGSAFNAGVSSFVHDVTKKVYQFGLDYLNNRK